LHYEALDALDYVSPLAESVDTNDFVDGIL